MSALLRGRNAVVFTALMLLMAATRFHHLGSALHLPDASLAVFFIGGALLPMMGFIALLTGAVGIDVLAMALSDRSGGAFGLGFCFTLSYAALPLGYGALWWMGRRVGRLRLESLRNAALAVSGWWLAASAAFLLSNGAFYWFSGRYVDPHGAEYVARAGKYYWSYMTSGLPYVLAAGVIAGLWCWRQAQVPSLAKTSGDRQA